MEVSVLQNQTQIKANWEFNTRGRGKSWNEIVRVVMAKVEPQQWWHGVGCHARMNLPKNIRVSFDGLEGLSVDLGKYEFLKGWWEKIYFFYLWKSKTMSTPLTKENNLKHGKVFFSRGVLASINLLISFPCMFIIARLNTCLENVCFWFL